MNQLPWIIVAGLAIALVAQGLVLRRAHRRRMAFQASVLQRSQLAMNNRLDKTKQQIGQLQSELGAARLQIARLDRQVAAASPSRAAVREKLGRMLDEDASAARRPLPVDSFADTQPADSLLLQ